MTKQSPTPKVVTKKHMARQERERRQITLIRAIAIAGVLIVGGLLLYGYLQINYFQLNDPVAEVNGEAIRTGEFQERVRFERVQMLNMYNQYAFYQQSFGFDYSQQMQQIAFTLQSPDMLGQQVLDQMIDEVLIRQEAEARGITVSDEEVEQIIQENFSFFPDGTPIPTITPTDVSLPTLTSQQLTLYPSTATPAPVTPTVEPTATNDPAVTPTATATTAPPTPTFVPQEPTASPTPFTLEGFQTQYQEMVSNFGSYNISENTVRAAYEMQLLQRKLRDDLTKDLPATDEQVWARHILVETAEEAAMISDKLAAGEDFAELARTNSKDTGSGANGGDLGWFGRGAMVAEFENVAFDLEIGEISEPVQSQFGYHIIQALGHDELPLNASQLEQKKESEFSEWLTTKRGESAIITFDVWRQRVPSEPSTLNPETPQ